MEHEVDWKAQSFHIERPGKSCRILNGFVPCIPMKFHLTFHEFNMIQFNSMFRYLGIIASECSWLITILTYFFDEKLGEQYSQRCSHHHLGAVLPGTVGLLKIRYHGSYNTRVILAWSKLCHKQNMPSTCVTPGFQPLIN